MLHSVAEWYTLNIPCRDRQVERSWEELNHTLRVVSIRRTVPDSTSMTSPKVVVWVLPSIAAGRYPSHTPDAAKMAFSLLHKSCASHSRVKSSPTMFPARASSSSERKTRRPSDKAKLEMFNQWIESAKEMFNQNYKNITTNQFEQIGRIFNDFSKIYNWIEY